MSHLDHPLQLIPDLVRYGEAHPDFVEQTVAVYASQIPAARAALAGNHRDASDFEALVRFNARLVDMERSQPSDRPRNRPGNRAEAVAARWAAARRQS